MTGSSTREKSHSEGRTKIAKGQSAAADKQLGISNKVAGQYGSQANQLFTPLAAAYGQEARSQGYDPATKSAMTTGTMSPVVSSYASQLEDAGRRAARTHNEAGQNALQAALARSRGQAVGGAAGSLQEKFADYRDKQRQAGLAGMANLYGTNADIMSRLYGLGPSTLQARAAGGPPPIWGAVDSALGAGGVIGASVLGKHG